MELDDTSTSGFPGLPCDWDIRLMHTTVADDAWKPAKQRKKQNSQMQLHDPARLVGSLLKTWEPQFIEADPLQAFEDVLKIGEGVSCSVYRAYDPQRKVEVAVKCFVPEHVEELDQFKLNFAVMGATSHRNLIKCYDAYKADNRYFVVTQLADGGCLRMCSTSLVTVECIWWSLRLRTFVGRCSADWSTCMATI